ncbi:PelD GGDEF domain-containing protein [Noviherbaspirillum suwonense]|uniref:GAF domain-containing protein n=1 Tax=Noviherbaspirillum suwonense TaxID=1224511 RepID=A0ABY1QAU8_9BURK|nr:PelD GGDEF domain-containing protein [Noviherbaspirillum suwonense]SMP65969.1 GAF domain-containing protein [Noviherbaspirillum suwonense]
MSTLLPLKRRPARARTLLRRLFPRGGVRAQQARPLADAFVGTALGATLHATSNWAWAVLEAGLICAAALACGVWLDPSDPFGLHAQFPWLWLAPALLAMRYGTGIGIIATLMMLVGWFALANMFTNAVDPVRSFPEQYFLGGLALVLVCGQFSDVWNARSRRLRAVNAYLDERLNTLTKNHFLLRLSHERLEQDLLAKPLTLRETLQRLRGASDASGLDGHGRLAGVDEFIKLLGQSCQLEIAAVHGLDARGLPLAAPHAALGTPGPLDLQDPLLRYSLEQGGLVHVQGDVAPQEARDSSRYLICAPLMPSRGPAVGLLVVEKLPFFALNDDLLKLLSVLIGYYADGVQAASVAREVTTAVPDCPPEMALDLVRLHRIRAEVGIESALVALVFERSDVALDIYEQVRRTRRGVDIAWELATPRHKAILTLLPLAGTAAVEGYLRRIESAIMSQHGVDFLSGHVVLHIEQLDETAPAQSLKRLVERCAL